MIARWPGQIPAGERSRELIALPDVMPSLCRLAGVPVPRTVEGRELAAALRGEACASSQEAVLLMNFSSRYDWFAGGMEWRGVRTALGETYARWLDGREDYYDLRSDPHQLRNLAGRPECLARQRELLDMLVQLQARRGDALLPAEAYRPWHDAQRRVIRNAFGPLPHPESEPNWDLLQECSQV
jgi:arylsulfatase A-like enzyme